MIYLHKNSLIFLKYEKIAANRRDVYG